MPNIPCKNKNANIEVQKYSVSKNIYINHSKIELKINCTEPTALFTTLCLKAEIWFGFKTLTYLCLYFSVGYSEFFILQRSLMGSKYYET